MNSLPILIALLILIVGSLRKRDPAVDAQAPVRSGEESVTAEKYENRRIRG